MKVILTQYEHRPIGFSQIRLNFIKDEGGFDYNSFYWKINGLIQGRWELPYEVTNLNHPLNIEKELKRFDDFIRSKYSDSPELQG